MADLIAQEWLQFRTAIGLDAAPAKQQAEMKNAFFAGACGCLNALGRAMAEEDADPSIIDDLEDEIMAFADQIIAGARS